jgi:hypothetical protein
MMIKDLEMSEVLTSAELSAVRGGASGIRFLQDLSNMIAGHASDNWEDAAVDLWD